MQIVKFYNGKYGLRKGNRFFGYKYRDLKGNYWWRDTSGFFCDCQGSLERVEEEVVKLKECYEVVRDV